MSVLTRLQTTLENLQDIQTTLDVGAYIVDEETRREIPGAIDGVPEQLFIREVGEEMEIALYVDPYIVEGLERDDPFKQLHSGNLEPFCIALEGVSHFILVAWCGSIGRSVSALELEVQAEVDKFIAAWLLLRAQGHPSLGMAQQLTRQLFSAYQVRDEMPHDVAERYHVASRAALAYCTGLARRYAHDRSLKRLLKDVRGFYRRSLADKLSV